MIGFLLAAAMGQPVAEAERAFAAQAQREGQWTAFRATSTADAIMLTPGPVKVHTLLAGAKDPPKAVAWGPMRTVTSCDGTLAFSTGPYRQPDGRGGRYLTVWQRQADGGWKWVYDGGTTEPVAPALPPPSLREDRATCGGAAPAPPAASKVAGGASADGSLVWRLYPGPIGKSYLLRVDYRIDERWQNATTTLVGG